MKPSSFGYLKAGSLDDIYDAFDRYGDEAKILAGGQSLVPGMNMRLAAPEVLIDINGLQALSGIAVEGDMLRIGALTRHADLGAAADVARHAPLLAKALPAVAHPAIRNRGTFGGSLANADPAAEFPACAVALDATINVASRGGSRSIAAGDFFLGIYETALEEDEILTSVDVPIRRDGDVCGFAELMRRHGDYATVGLAAHGSLANGACSAMRLVFFGVSDKPVRAVRAEALLEGHPLTDETIRAARDVLGDDIGFLADVHTSGAAKAHMARVLCERVLHDMSEPL